jgi:periplasmic protein TonB
MTTIAMRRGGWSWLRVGAWSGSVALHVALLLVVMAPIVAPLAPHAPEPVVAQVIEREPPPDLPEPPPPVAPHHVRPVVPRTPAPPVAPPTPMSTVAPDVPVTPPETSVPTTIADAAPSTSATPDIGASGASQTLAYATPVRPRYPADSARAHEEGTVVLRVLVDADGRPQRVEIARSSGHARLDAAARDGVLHARFRPVMRDGAAVEAWGLVPVAFKLERG